MRLVRDKELTLKRAKLTTRLIAGDTASGVPDFAVGQKMAGGRKRVSTNLLMKTTAIFRLFNPFTNGFLDGVEFMETRLDAPKATE